MSIETDQIISDRSYFLKGEEADVDKPSYRSEAYDRMCADWTLVDDVYAGTDRIREKAKIYLPKFPLESDSSYAARCQILVLMNVYARTVDAMVGLVIGSGLKVENVPEAMSEHLKNIDNAGTSFEIFARDLLRDAFDGHVVCLIDMPDVPEERRPKNRTEARSMKIRPYWTRRKPEDIYNWRVETIDGETVITQITFRECVSVPVGRFGEQDEVRYLVWGLEIDPVSGKRTAVWEKYREVERSVKKKGQGPQTVIDYELIGSGETHLSRIPMFIVYGDNRSGKILESKPPLLDLAHKNIEHLQIDSDYKKGLGIAGLAIPVLKTQKSDEDIEKVFSWDQIMVIGEDEEFEFKEANGQALPNKRTALEDIKREMGVLGLSLIAERADANITATERVLDSVQQSNQLMAIQASLIQGLRQGLEIHAEWMKQSAGEASVGLSLDWTELVRSADHMQTLFEMAKEDFLSTLTLIEAAGQYGVLPAYVDAEQEVDRLKKEGRVRQSRFMMKSTTTSDGVQVSKINDSRGMDTKDESSGNESTRVSMTETGGS